MADASPQQVADYLAYLGERVRGWRAARGMTRKQLSAHSETSERYLAQLEGGTANPSVAVLWRIADALGLDFHDLLAATAQPTLDHGPLGQLLRTLSEPEQENAYQWLRQRLGGAPRARRGVALIGLRGAGKTTLGKALAQSLSLPFFRLTDVIEQLGGMEIGELFALGGQKSYRRLERQALDHLLAQDRPLVIDVGGSLVSEPATFNLLRQAFVTVWLKADPQDHMDRVIRQGDTRPMEGNREAMADLRRILAEREHDYQKAHHVVQTSARSIDECVIELRAIATAHRSLDLPG